jgi:hypothetical protein
MQIRFKIMRQSGMAIFSSRLVAPKRGGGQSHTRTHHVSRFTFHALRFTLYASACTVACALTAPPAGNPYEGIVTRNVFGLKPMPVAAAPEPPKPQAPKVTLTGITTMLGRKRALFKAQLPAKPPDPAREQSYILAEGERDGDMEVVEIDDKAGSIKVKYLGDSMTVAFSKDSEKTGNLAAVPAGTFVAPAAAPANPFAQPAGGVTGIQSIPTRPIRTAQAQAEGVNPAQAGLPGSTSPGQAGAAQYDNSEESALMAVANRLKREDEWRQEGRPVPHLPVHPALKGLGLFDSPAPAAPPPQP